MFDWLTIMVFGLLCMFGMAVGHWLYLAGEKIYDLYIRIRLISNYRKIYWFLPRRK